jgi:hypothetical protein
MVQVAVGQKTTGFGSFMFFLTFKIVKIHFFTRKINQEK